MGLDFLILYEHIVREFESNCLLMAELRKRGYSVELMQLMSRKKLRYFLWKKPKVILTSAMYDNETLNSFVYNNVGRLNRVINLHWEEVLSREQEQSDFYSLKQNAAKCVHICWGEAAKERIVSHGVGEGNAVVTGAMHLDFLDDNLKKQLLGKHRLSKIYGLDESLNWALYISSFSCASMDDAEIEELNNMTALDFTGFRAVGLRTMKTTLEWLERLLIDRPNTLVIYRPHPSEWESSPLAELQKRYHNFRVISEYAVREWVYACDTIISWMSTSIAEVYFLKKNCIILRSERLYDDYDPVIYEGCDAADSYDELLKRFDSSNERFPIEPHLIEAHYSFIPGIPAYTRIADLCERVYHNEPHELPFSEGYTPHFNLLKFITLFMLNLIVTLRINPKYFRFLFGKPFTDKAARLIGYIKKSKVSRRAIEQKVEEYGRMLL